MERTNSERPRRVEAALTQLALAVDGAARGLAETWAHSESPKESVECLALWHTVQLDEMCSQNLDHYADPPILPLSAADGTPEVRYEIEAAMRMVVRLFPFHDFERLRLRAHPAKTPNEWGGAMTQKEPKLVAHWHRWLWSKPHYLTRVEDDHGAAAVFAVAVGRLCEGLGDVLDS